MGKWKAVKAKQLYAALLSAGWTLKRSVGSHRLLEHAAHGTYLVAFHDSDEVGPVMVSKVARATGLTPEEL